MKYTSLKLHAFVMISLFVGYYILAFEKYKFLKHNKPLNLKPLKSISGDNTEYLYFIQVTDTHITTNKDGTLDDRGLSELVSEINKLNPSFFVHTGDITDGISNNSEFTICEDDFKAYSDFKNKLKCPVYDVRGNHDTFGTDDAMNEMIVENYVYGKRNFHEMVKIGNFRYLFLFVDATPKFGSKRVLNFFGEFEDKDFRDVVRALKSLYRFDQILLFTHYPSNTLCTKDQDSLQASVYLCGHLHNFLLFDKIYKKHKNGCFETVLEDFKTSKKLRICTLDHGNFSFNDFRLEKGKPIVVIMTPCESNFKSPNSHFLRVLGFYCDDLIAEIDGVVRYFPIRDGTFYCMALPRGYKRITVKGTNEFGSSTHTITDPSDNFSASIPILMPFKYIPVMLTMGYLLVYFWNIRKIPAYIPILRIFLLIVLPNAILRPFTNSIEILSSLSLSRVTAYDAVFFFSISVFLEESLFVLALTDRLFIIPYNLLSYVIAFKLYSHFGPLLRLEDIFLLISNYYFLMKVGRARKKHARLDRKPQE